MTTEQARTRIVSPLTGLTKAETIFLNGVLPAIVLGICTPVGLVAFCLVLQGAPVKGAIDHGELLLGAGNAAMVGAFAFLSARPNQSMWGTIGAFGYIVAGIFSYAGWAWVTMSVITHSKYSHDAVVTYGIIAATSLGVVSLFLVAQTFRPPLNTSSR